MKKIMMAAALTVLVAACTEKQNEMNPFFTEYSTPFEVPPFNEIKQEHYKPAFIKGMEEEAAEIEAICNNPEEPTFENTIAAMDQSGKLLRKAQMVFYGLSGANSNDEMDALNQEMSPQFSKHSDDIRLNPVLFTRIKSVYEKKDQLNLNKEDAKLLEETYKSFVRGGANLPEDKQELLRKLNSEISLLQISFAQNMRRDADNYKLIIEKESDLAGLSETQIATAAQAAKAAGLEGKWVFTLANPSALPFLQNADNRELRKELFEAYINRGNNNNENDNKEIVRKLVEKRLEKAQLMGYEDYASFVLEDRMAQTPESVYELLNELWTPSLKKAKEELTDIQAEIKKEGKNFTAEGWDWRYYFEKAKKAKFNLDENEIRPYLKLENVRDGAFYVAGKLYGITFSSVSNLPLPHPDAEAFECKDKDGTHLGILYMDYFPRKGKRSGAWCGAYRAQTYKDGKRLAPVVTIVCNFSEPTPGKPALLSADEASTLFHEFGHGLHNLFKDVHYYGIAGVPRDFVELPSQIMEHWTLEPEVLKVYAKHYETGELIPEELIEKLDKSGKYGQGFATTEYLAAAYLDMDYHVLKQIPNNFNVADFEFGTLAERGLLKQIPARYRSTYFNHTMGGGYTAGYYSYIWAEVLDCDAYQAFVETGDIYNQEVAARFRNYILTPGGIDNAMDMYINFRGSKPGTEALLENRGLK
ncbi:M3 family metallopeptidase [Bacteroides sp. 224]|uniref:M3 family metallopeptidase n=1 Tax=Bacteroides sp. 224 TaxID=2302936 RepID=UPI0013D6702B|nr:M3 family metallopeptidase [Bacteroides sp. 224]NDV64776.1 M3 family peptidase [Bacteroides sp. 224]